ncbi:hypothetical protein BVX98_00580 [bacterium F11]|nr:hypothetical protein BVX98_00580 [bacterium F11]
MNSVFLGIACLLILGLGYKLYGTFLSSLLGIDPRRRTPAHEKKDEVDFVPAKHWLVLFGHHFSSICGAGPIVGPVLAVAYWGWGVSLAWILLGSILMGAVSDFSSLVVSIRFNGESIPEIARSVMTKRSRLLLSVFIWLSLILVIAVFAILAAKTFTAQPEIVVPSLGIIPLAVLMGWMLYFKKWGLIPTTIFGLVVLGLLLLFGDQWSVRFVTSAGLNIKIWIVILILYCFVASVTPVQYLLQPRDYLAGFVLFAAIGFGLLGLFLSHKPMNGPAFSGWNPNPEIWPSAGPLWPMLFVTIACGAISGFHSLVSSGTTCKQLDTEAHACRIGYGGMLTEGLVACLVVFCVAAGLTRGELLEFLTNKSKGGPIAAFGNGFGSLTSPLLGSYGTAFAIVALNAFILTTLDTATRIGRYLTSELFGIENRFLSTFLVVFLSALLALTGQWQRIWPVFGASNQLVAALSLLVVSCWLISIKRPSKTTLIPALIMLTTTIGAFLFQIVSALGHVNAKGESSPQITIILSAAVLVVLALAVFYEAVKTYQRFRLKVSL